MNKEYVFNLYKRILHKDKNAEDELIELHKKIYPNNSINKEKRGTSSDYRLSLHSMYLNLHRKYKK